MSTVKSTRRGRALITAARPPACVRCHDSGEVQSNPFPPGDPRGVDPQYVVSGLCPCMLREPLPGADEQYPTWRQEQEAEDRLDLAETAGEC